jgi:hypothetical protein
MAIRQLLLGALLGGLTIFGSALARPRAPDEGTRIVYATAADLLRLAEDLDRRGQRGEADRLLTLLSHDPNSDVRNEARFRRSKLMSADGKTTEAAVLLRQILDERPNAAPVRLELAQLLDRIGDKDGAWREVRAAQASGLPPEVARMVDRYSEALRAARPFGASFQIALAPDSNINTSTQSDTLGTIFGDFAIDEGSKAKSGVGLSLSGQVFRRLRLGGDHAILGRISTTADLYRKTDFNDIALDIAAGPELQLGKNRVNVEAAATQRWYGMERFMRSARLSVSLIRPIGMTTQLQLMGSAGLADYRLNDLQDGKTFFGRLKLEHALSATTGIGVNLSAGRTTARDPAYSTKEWRVGLIGWRDVGRATLTAEAEYGRLRADDRLALLPDARFDSYSCVTFGATFRQLTFGGFAPVTRVSIERNRSSVEFYDYKRRRTEIGIVRAF